MHVRHFANQLVIRGTSNVLSGLVSSRLSMFRPLAVIGQLEIVGRRRVRGLPVRMGVSDHGDYLAFSGWETREPETLDWIDGFHSESTFLDVGCNVGMFTIYAAARHHDRVAVYGVDPDARVSHRIARNIELNGLTAYARNMVAGVGETDGFATISFNRSTQQGHLGRSAFLTDRRQFSYTVPTVSIDSLVERGLITAPTYIKVDVDGQEVDVVEGAHDTLRSGCVRSALIEVLPETEAPVVELLRSAGYRVELRGPERGFTVRATNLIFTRSATEEPRSAPVGQPHAR